MIFFKKKPSRRKTLPLRCFEVNLKTNIGLFICLFFFLHKHNLFCSAILLCFFMFYYCCCSFQQATYLLSQIRSIIITFSKNLIQSTTIFFLYHRGKIITTHTHTQTIHQQRDDTSIYARVQTKTDWKHRTSFNIFFAFFVYQHILCVCVENENT